MMQRKNTNIREERELWEQETIMKYIVPHAFSVFLFLLGFPLCPKAL